MNRPKVSKQEVADVLDDVLDKVAHKLNYRIQQKGNNIFVSRHEICGIIREEVGEFEDLLSRGSLDDMREELLDIAIAAIWGVASIDSDEMDW